MLIIEFILIKSCAFELHVLITIQPFPKFQRVTVEKFFAKRNEIFQQNRFEIWKLVISVQKAGQLSKLRISSLAAKREGLVSGLESFRWYTSLW